METLEKQTTTNEMQSDGHKDVHNDIENVAKLRKAVNQRSDYHSQVGGKAR